MIYVNIRDVVTYQYISDMIYVNIRDWRFAKQPYSAEILGESMRQSHVQR